MEYNVVRISQKNLYLWIEKFKLGINSYLFIRLNKETKIKKGATFRDNNSGN